MIVLMKGLNEEYSVKRVLSSIHDQDFCSRIIVIDGGSTDYTVQECKEFSKVEVYVHPWLDWYHDMEVSQSNIGLSYIPQGQLAFILDFDEKPSNFLIEELDTISREDRMPGDADIGQVPRRTFEPIRLEDSPHAMLSADDWPMISHQIGQYPDFQCRIFKKDYRMRWVNSPHHLLIGWESMTEYHVNPDIDAHIIHYEKDDLRDRHRIERKWARAVATRKTLGLQPDVYEVNIQPEVHKYTNPEVWK